MVIPGIPSLGIEFPIDLKSKTSSQVTSGSHPEVHPDDWHPIPGIWVSSLRGLDVFLCIT